MNKISFDAGWEFTEASGMMAAFMAQWQPVTLPHDLSIAKARQAEYPTFGGGGYAWSGVVTYRKKFLAPMEWQDGAVLLELEGAYMNAKVSVNGNVAGFRPYGYSSFHADLKPYLKFGEQNEITVVVNNSAQPNSRWYSGTGIYRHVWLRLGGGVHIKPWGVFVSTPVVDPAASSVRVTTEIENGTRAAQEIVLRSQVLDASGEVAAQAETAYSVGAKVSLTASQMLTVSEAKLWSVEAPNLYTLVSEVTANGEVLDREQTVFGIRSIEIDAEGGFRLNGVPMKLKGGCVHHDNGLLGAASYDRAEERKIELMKSAGYNAVRCAHNIPAPAMLDACDRLGMLVIDETFDCWRMGKNPNDYHLYFEDWWQRDTETMVRRDRNHASIILWSIGNEVPERTGASDGYEWADKQAALVRLLDPTRGVTSALPMLFEEMLADPEALMQSLTDMQSLFDPKRFTPTDPATDRWGNLTREFCQALDVVGYNYLFTRYEFDGVHFAGRVMAGTETFPHQAFEYWQETERFPYVIGDFVWTSIDYVGESGIGKVSFVEGEMPFGAAYPYHLANCGDFDICGFKRPQSYFRDILWGVRKIPFIAVWNPEQFGKKANFNQWGWEPVSERWDFAGQEGKPTRVEVYSADEEVELWINGLLAGRKPAGAGEKNKAVFEVTYQPGEITAVGFAGGKETGRFTLHTAGKPAALRLTADRPQIGAAYGDLAYVTVEVVDAAGKVVKPAEPEVVLSVEGAGELIAVGTANPLSEELYVGDRRKAFEGRLMAVVRSSGEAGEIIVKAAAEGLEGAAVRVKV